MTRRRAAPTSCSTRSTPSSARSPRRCAGRCGCWPARAPARPGRSPTGSPTASPPASTTRPRCSRSPSPPAPPARCATRLRSARRRRGAGPHLPLRGAAPGCATSGRKVYGGELPALTESKLGLVGNAARRNRVEHRPGDAARPGLARSSGPRSATSAPTTTPRVAAARGRAVTGLDPATVARVFATYEEVKRDQGRMDMEDVLLLRRRRCSPRTSGSPRRSAGSTSGSSSTSSRTSARSSRRCSTCGSAAATSSAWSATRPRRSTPSPAPTPRYLRDFPQKLPGHHVGRAGPQLPLHAPGGRGRQPAARRAAEPRGASCAPSSPTGPAVRYAARPDEVAEAEAVADADPARCARRARRPSRDRGAVPDQRPVRGVRGGARRARHPVRRARRRPVLRPRRRCARR